MIHWSSGAQIFRVSSPEVSLSMSKKSISSQVYFPSNGSFKMAKNCNIWASFWMIQTFPRPKILHRDQKKSQLSKYQTSFSLVFLRFLQKIKFTFFIIEWSRFFGENRAVSPFIIFDAETLWQVLGKSYDRLSGKSVNRITTPPYSSPKGENWYTCLEIFNRVVLCVPIPSSKCQGR